ncbi:LPP20 family lipoprotein [Vibrio neonatus]|uniref:LPP20 family lipoprotein n=1 Tax=Vibrio neonatus TaxID=278860 RepID=UPI0021C3872F|nr:LPP20 family lipoprotein [Vibrio neonatus]
MNKSRKVQMCMLSLLTVLLVGCSSSDAEKTLADSKAAASKEQGWCKYDDGVTEAPEFVCTDQIDGYSLAARGSYNKSAAGMNFMVSQASLAARVQLAQQIRAQVSALVKSYIEQTGSADQLAIDAVASSVSRSLSDEEIIGSKVIRKIVAPSGKVYVWVGIDEKNLLANQQKAIRTSMNNEEALWQKVEAKKAHDEMLKEISELKSSK